MTNMNRNARTECEEDGELHVTDAMLQTAMKKAVELGFLPERIDGETYLKNWNDMRAILQAAFNVNRRRKHVLDDTRAALLREKVEQLRLELATLGLESSFFYRAPGAAKAPVAYLLIGETQVDVEVARNT